MWWEEPASHQVTPSSRSHQSQTPVCVCVPAHFTLIHTLAAFFFPLSVSGLVCPVILPPFPPWLVEEEPPLHSSWLLWTNRPFFSDDLHFICVPPAEIRRGSVIAGEHRFPWQGCCCEPSLSSASEGEHSCRAGVFINNLCRHSQHQVNTASAGFLF